MQIKVIPSTPKKIERLVFNLLDIFDTIGIPVEGTNRKLERMAKACLAVGQIFIYDILNFCMPKFRIFARFYSTL